MSWDDAPHDIGLEMVYTFAIDANGNYVATVPTESISGWDVDAYFGMHDFIGTNLQQNTAMTADTTRNAHYYLNNSGGLQDVLENDIEAGDIITGVNLTFTYTLLP